MKVKQTHLQNVTTYKEQNYWHGKLVRFLLVKPLFITYKTVQLTRKRVMSIAILPGTTSGGMRKLTHETTTNKPEGR